MQLKPEDLKKPEKRNFVVGELRMISTGSILIHRFDISIDAPFLTYLYQQNPEAEGLEDILTGISSSKANDRVDDTHTLEVGQLFDPKEVWSYVTDYMYRAQSQYVQSIRDNDVQALEGDSDDAQVQ